MRDPIEFKSVRKKTKLSHLVLNSIKEALVNGTLQPGDRLPSMSELAEQMEVGISSVREAVKMLEGLDILESKQGEGTFVCSELNDGAFNALSLQLMLMPRSAEGLVEFRRMYETAYTYLAMNNAKPEDITALENIVTDQEKRAETTHLSSQDERAFHFCVLNCTHNPYVIRLGQALVELFLSTIPTSGAMSSRFSMVQDHRNILDAIQTKNVTELNRVLEKSFDGWGQRLVGKAYVEPESFNS